MLNRLMTSLSFAAARSLPRKVKTVRHRIKNCMKNPEYYQLRTLIRPPNLKDPSLVFPIKIPMRYRQVRVVRKQLFLDNSSKIHWNRLQPNEILLAFEQTKYLSFAELTQGLRYLSEVKGQSSHNWNEHEWVKSAMDAIKDQFFQIKKPQTVSYYRLMKKLGYKDQTFWKKMYANIVDNIYDIYPSQFEYFLINYYENLDEVFGEGARSAFLKLMEGRLREFKPESILFLFEKFNQQNKLDKYWLETVFISLFKQRQYTYTGTQIARIFRNMMIIGHEDNERLYSSLYARIADLQFRDLEEVQFLEQVLLEVKELFISHRVEPSLAALEVQKEELSKQVESKPKTLIERVQDDMKYYMQKKKMKLQNQQLA